eukprot:scaffold54665_cov22-Tisochrysis_lutea.AAC.1
MPAVRRPIPRQGGRAVRASRLRVLHRPPPRPSRVGAGDGGDCERGRRGRRPYPLVGSAAACAPLSCWLASLASSLAVGQQENSDPDTPPSPRVNSSFASDIIPNEGYKHTPW